MRSERHDVVVVGGGPAGLEAALAALEAGVRVALLDDNPDLGGQVWRRDARGGAPSDPAAPLRAELLERGGVVHRRCAVFDAPEPGRLLALVGETELLEVSFRRLVLATGARERFLPFPGWTRPGVLGLGGLQAMIKAGMPVGGKRLVVAGTGPLLYAVAQLARQRGAALVAVLEQAPARSVLRFGLGLLAHPRKLVEGLRLAALPEGVESLSSAWPLAAEGDEELRRVVVRTGRGRRVFTADLLACGYGLVPETRLARRLGCALGEYGAVSVDELQRSSVPGILAAGEITGVGGRDKAAFEGMVAGLVATDREDEARPLLFEGRAHRRFVRALARRFALSEELKTLAGGDTVVCRCEDVTLDAVRGARDFRDAKLRSRCGMGACQARVCGPALEYLFGWPPESPRPPLFPVPLGLLAAAHPSRESSP